MGYNKIVLHGEQWCDYLHIEKDDTNASAFKSIDAEPKTWNDNTLLSAKFNNNLMGGNSSILDKIIGYEVRRREMPNSHTEYVGTIRETAGKNAPNFMIDYLAGNKKPYMYYLYPNSKSEDNTKSFLLAPNISDEVAANWKYWSLMVADESDEENVFYLDKLFKFGLNLSVSDINNNASINVIQNFTEFPTLQFGTSNYWSGDLTSLCGYISCTDNEYVQPPNIIQEFKKLTSDTRRKFLKDMDGNVYEVQVISSIVVSPLNNGFKDIKSVKISWAEVGKVDGLSVINNPNKTTNAWLLTETGEVVPYMNYVWDGQSRWDNSHRWTAKGDPSDVDVDSSGLNLFNEGGD